MDYKLTALLVATTATQALAGIEPAQAEFFEKQIRPVLVEKCYDCHGPDKQKSGLRLDSRDAMLKGGDGGPSLIPGKPDESTLIQSVRHIGDMKMPAKKDKMPEAEIAALAEWVRIGAPWPEHVKATASAQEKAREHWSYQPITKPALPKTPGAEKWARTEPDQFILAKLSEKKIAPSPQADRRTLLRRATFALTGLPPSAEEVSAFEKDPSPEAWTRQIDRLLASPAYGERWARHWLDVARYSDSKGYVFQENREYPFAYTYRDWVVRAMNDDLPYDKFLHLQIAADRMLDGGGATQRDLAAMGFLTVGRRFLNNPHDIIDDRIDLLTRGVMGVTVACARCHDHKFDPISQADYYALYGVFASSNEPKELPLLPDDAPTDPAARAEFDKSVAAAQAKVDGALDDFRRSVATALGSITGVPLTPSREHVRRLQNRADRDKVRNEENKLAAIHNRTGAPPRAMSMQDNSVAQNGRVFIRGNPGRPGAEVPRSFPTIFTKGERQPFNSGSGRLELAQSMTSRENPLTARVLVNRVWMLHFGRGLVRTTGDFGVKGEAPTHPELLDWLATWFMDNGWSLKKLHRLILASATWQQRSEARADAFAADPENTLVWRQTMRRLDLEAMRDAMLATAGRLDRTLGGQPVDALNADTRRRTLYAKIERQNLPGFFRTFDFASPDLASPMRYQTSVPQQALYFLNGKFAVQQAGALCSEYAATDPAQASDWQIQKLYQRIFQRPARDAEIRDALDFLRSQPRGTNSHAMAWSYGYGRFNRETGSVEFSPLPKYTGQNWQGDGKLPDKKLGWTHITATGGHPGGTENLAAIRRWTAPEAMKISIASTLSRPAKQGNGIIGRIISSRTGRLWKAEVAPTASAAANLENVEVQAGETLDFIVEANANDENSDAFTWSPVIRAAGHEWNATAQFSGQVSNSLSPWTRYAQALLATNEFLFVD